MKPLIEQDHYEVLDLPRDAGPEEVERAYALALSTYDSDSVALYSVFDASEAEQIRERIEVAYRVLADPEARRSYDALPVPAGEELGTPADPEPVRVREEDAGLDAFDALDELGSDQGFDGARLRRARLRRAIDLQEIARVTKISPNTLQLLEEERFAELPAPVYVRGFVAAYARCLGLDGARVAATYMQRLPVREEPRKSRLRGRL